MDATEDMLDRQMSQFIRSTFYDHWRTRVEASRGCSQPIHLAGTYQVQSKASGQVLHDRSGQIMVACGTRRADQCPSCSQVYAQDAFHLIRAGLTGDDAKGIPAAVANVPRLFLTLTAPSFGKVHSRRFSAKGKVLPCVCGEHHHEADTRLHGAVNPDEYDYEAAVLWQAHSGVLWQRWCMRVRRLLAQIGGVTTRELSEHLTLSYSKVAEFQRRGMIHFHAVVRVDGPDGAGSPPPAWVTPEMLAEVVKAAADSVEIEAFRPTGEVLTLRFGGQVLPEVITTTDGPGGKSAASIAGYIAKYATKSSGVTESGVDRRMRSRDHIKALKISEHHRNMMLTAWDLGGLAAYEDLNLRRWAHMLGFRGHFLTKSKVYSTTFQQLKTARQLHRMAELIASLDVTGDEITVINEWEMTSVGHADGAERELAQAIQSRLVATGPSRGDS
ncbi:MAG: replication initiator [Gammaproteobacteria bacterium]